MIENFKLSRTITTSWSDVDQIGRYTWNYPTLDLNYYESGIYQYEYGAWVGWTYCEFVGYGEENVGLPNSNFEVQKVHGQCQNFDFDSINTLDSALSIILKSGWLI
ncbi:Hypothetical_protein [Hexamita inflata]|uniref:Hypothetical_protein n=1 Tax=Hexamita inflata TaxID=28002 RepID=A0AA86QW95_9EUKA|nr:Hypothetical protein HINF_LOCUS685 [Hexamita inflata]CAI9961952.1 Hypothetical protein HINF_LOCUS49597 [Hexamita inflata]CAI9961958.1 Hypothetical protein HINF_LOCUS49603 [Hexamita inflata]